MGFGYCSPACMPRPIMLARTFIHLSWRINKLRSVCWAWINVQ